MALGISFRRKKEIPFIRATFVNSYVAPTKAKFSNFQSQWNHLAISKNIPQKISREITEKLSGIWWWKVMFNLSPHFSSHPRYVPDFLAAAFLVDSRNLHFKISSGTITSLLLDFH